MSSSIVDEELALPEIPCAYYDISELNNNLDNDNKLIIIHHNIRSFNKNYDNLSLMLSNCTFDIDIIILTETWFTENFCTEISGYTGFHIFRPVKGGGGVSIFVRAELKCAFLPEFSSVTETYEICAVEISLEQNNDRNKCIILGVYRPPNTLMSHFSEKIENLMMSVVQKSVIISGDLNLDLLEEDINSDILNLFYSYNYFPLITIATRITDNSATCIDHIWYNKLNVSLAGSVIADITDHYPVFAAIEVVKINNLITKTFRDHSDVKVDRLCTDVENMCADFFVECNTYDVNYKCEWFTNNLMKLYYRDCPKQTKTLTIKRLLKPWITANIRRMANFKHYLFKQYKQNNISFQRYNLYKNNLNNVIKKAKRNFYISKFENSNRNIKKTWKTINSVLTKSKKTSNKISLLDRNGDEVHDPVNIANMFCDHFSTIADQLDADIPMTNTDPMCYMPDPVPESFIPSPTSTEEIENLICSLSDKPCHINNIPIFIIKKLSHIIAPVICDIFTDSIRTGTFPSILKIARIMPLHKGKNNKIISNYRPISLLPILSKLIEKLLKTRVLQFINDNNILYNRQFGFRSGCSTSDAILLLADDCVTALDCKLYTIAIFLDFSKAFDTVNKDIMLSKLDRLGFRGNVNKFFESYLSNRKMYVCVNGNNSRTATINIGLPQGSVSAPWLFSLYINDMHRSSKKLNFLHFADDTTVYMSGYNLTELCNEVCLELNAIDDWLKSNRLSLNIDKTQFMIYTHNNFNVDDCIIKIRDRQIHYVKTTKFLGLHIDDRLNYNGHLIDLSKKLSRIKGLLLKLSSYVPAHIVRQIYFALFYSRMVYGISVWGGSNITYVNRIININRAALTTFRNRLPDSIPNPLPFDKIYQYNCLNSFHKYKNDVNFDYFNSKICNLTPVHDHVTRFAINNCYLLPVILKTVGQKQFFFNAIKQWNSLPQELKNIPTTDNFKREFKAFLKRDL